MAVEKIEIALDKEKETLLVPLVCSAQESERADPIIRDPEAVRLVERIGYDYAALKIPESTRITLCIRAQQLDRYTRTFLEEYPSGTVIHLGCGLDTRYFRLDNGTVTWYDLDYPDVIALRRKFYDETDRYHLILSSVTDLRWMDAVSNRNGPFLILAEGLFMYLHDEDVKALVIGLQSAFPQSLLVFDCFSAQAVRRMAGHPSIRKTGAEIFWGIDNASEIEQWHEGITLLEEWYFTQSDEVRKLNAVYRALFAAAGLFSTAKKAHRIVAFRLD